MGCGCGQTNSEHNVGQCLIPEHPRRLKCQPTQRSLDGAVDDFHLSMGLWVVRGGLKSVNIIFLQQYIKSPLKFPSIVAANCSGTTIFTDNEFSKESCQCVRALILKWLCHNKFGEYIHTNNHNVLALATFWQPNNQVQTPNLQWLDTLIKRGQRSMLDKLHLLAAAREAIATQLEAIGTQSRPVDPLL